MRTLRIALCLLPLVALGCRVNSGQLLLEQESRRWEDEAYRLSGCLEDCHAAREATIRENEELKRELAELRDGGGSSSSTSSPAPRKSLIPRPRRGEAPSLEPPTIELPEPSDTPGTELPGVEMPGPGDSSNLGDGPPTQLVINRQMTGGLDRDHRAGDEGLTLMVEPRDADGNLVKATGTISVVAMDPALEGDASRVARWDFQPDELPRHFRNSSLAQGYQFELPWPGAPPQHRDLRLFVRYTSDEGRRITADSPVAIRHTSDPPVANRAGVTRESESARRTAPKRSPASRVKSRSAAAPRGDVSATEEDASGEGEIRQARSERPEWKPFR